MTLNSHQLQNLHSVVQTTLTNPTINDLCVKFYQDHSDQHITYEQLFEFKKKVLPLEDHYSQSIQCVSVDDRDFTLSDISQDHDRIEYTYIQDNQPHHCFCYLNLQGLEFVNPDFLQDFFYALIAGETNYLTKTYLEFSKQQTSEELFKVFTAYSLSVEALYIEFKDSGLQLTSNYTQKGLIIYSLNEGHALTFAPLVTGEALNRLWDIIFGALSSLAVGDTMYYDRMLEQLSEAESFMIARIMFDEMMVDEYVQFVEKPIHVTIDTPTANQIQMRCNVDILELQKRSYRGFVNTEHKHVIDFFTQLHTSMTGQDPASFNFFTKKFDGVTDQYDIRDVAKELILETTHIRNSWDNMLISLTDILA